MQFEKVFGVIWIGMVVFLSFVIANNHPNSGMAAGFLIMSVYMVYGCFSGLFDEPKPKDPQTETPTTDNPTQQC